MNNEKPTRKTAKSPVDIDEAIASGTKPGAKVRLQRALASAGYGSRRQCEELIIEGRVIVDGEVVDTLGATVTPSTQKIFVDGTPLKPRRLVYYALNKPVGIVTTNVDPEGRPRVIDLVPPDERVFPVGRLDRSSEGLILLTNDGELAQKLAHPKYEIQKVYRVVVAGKIAIETLRQMEKGIYIAEGLVKVEGARIMKTRGRATELEITLKEGKNREIRRILARLGHKVQQLKRIAIGPLRLGEMPTGAFRKLGFDELKKLKASVDPSVQRTSRSEEKTPTRRPSVKKRSGSFGDASSKRYATKSTRGPVSNNRRPVAKRKPEVDIKIDRVVTGAIIGADPAPPKQERVMREDRIPRPKKSAPKKAASKRSFGRGNKSSRLQTDAPQASKRPTLDSKRPAKRTAKGSGPKRKGRSS